MKQTLAIILNLLLPVVVLAQNIINESPYVNTDFKKYLYVNFDNPVYISTGKFKSVKASVSNGTITKTSQEGKYIIKPERCDKTIVTLSGTGFQKTFEFECAILHPPTIGFAGRQLYDHNEPSIRYSSGIYVKHTSLDLDISYRVDSFWVTIKDSLQGNTHLNIGAEWDLLSLKMLKEARNGSYIFIDKIALTGPDNKICWGEPFASLMWEK